MLKTKHIITVLPFKIILIIIWWFYVLCIWVHAFKIIILKREQKAFYFMCFESLFWEIESSLRLPQTPRRNHGAKSLCTLTYQKSVVTKMHQYRGVGHRLCHWLPMWPGTTCSTSVLTSIRCFLILWHLVHFLSS